MPLIKSISGIRGTIGGMPGKNLTPPDIISFTSGFASLLKARFPDPKLVIGRDGRSSGPLVQALVASTLQAMGVHVLDAGLTTTPSLEMAVTAHHAQGGIMITASHNSMAWNALKFMNEKGEFIDAETGQALLNLASEQIQYSPAENLGGYTLVKNSISHHIKSILKLKLVDPELVKNRKFRIVVDTINSTGSLAIPPLLEKLGCEYVLLNGEMNGIFAHDPEPLPEHLSELSNLVVKNKADLGIVVDPDVDRLAFVCENGEPFGEEYTLVALADYITSKEKGNTVSNLSSTQALRDITIKNGGQYSASAVGEVNVVARMKEIKAVIGGEGNGGVIYPKLHYGRDAMVGIALFLTQLAESGLPVSLLRSRYPNYEISKNKIELAGKSQMDIIFTRLREQYQKHKLNSEDGLRIDLDGEWVHLRQSNTEPIIRIYAESSSKVVADHLAQKLIRDIREIQKELK